MAEELKYCRMKICKDAQGKEILLKDDKFQVMMEWERPYMEACVDALHPFGDVLEIGFGLGYSATHIQRYRPKSHTIIEYHPVIAEHARTWAKNYPNVTIVEDTWQRALPQLPRYDAIFFDDYPLYDETQMHAMQQQTSESNHLLHEGESLLRRVEEQLPFLKSIRYQEGDLEELFTLSPPNTKAKGVQLIRFLQELQRNGQITFEQLQRFGTKGAQLGGLTEEDLKALQPTEQKTGPYDFGGPNERLLTFLSQCLKHHMRDGSRFSCFLSSSTSKYEDRKFFQEIITNPYLDYREELIEIDVPDSCDYFHGSTALVITIVKRE